jgi:hypothetical protein
MKLFKKSELIFWSAKKKQYQEEIINAQTEEDREKARKNLEKANERYNDEYDKSSNRN